MTERFMRPERLIKAHVAMRFGNGVVLGKFMPPHNGHLYLIEFARACCYRLTIIVCALDEEPIPGHIRYGWMKELYPDCNVVLLDRPIPQYPDESPDFFTIWADTVRRVCGEAWKPDVFFASESYGYDMAAALGCVFMPVDERRELVPVSGTKVRRDPMTNWDYLHPVVRPYFVKRVAVIGPESSGKSSLSKRLADHFATCYVSEYARGMLASYGEHVPGYNEAEPQLEDISTIARGQLVSEMALAKQANKVLFTDTDLLTTAFWSNWYFQQVPEWVDELAHSQTYHLTLLMDPRPVADAYVPDIQRPMPDLQQRVEMYKALRLSLIALHRPFVEINGNDWATREEQAIKAVTQLIQPANTD